MDYLDTSSFKPAESQNIQPINKFYNTHPFHLVDPSSLPFLLSLSALGIVLSAVLFMHPDLVAVSSKMLLLVSVLVTVYLMGRWWLNVTYESYVGYHTIRVKKGLKLGFILFIVSEIMFFFGFFWAFFHSSLSPAIELGAVWPPYGIEPFDPMTFPFLNTIVLLLSGLSITYTHYYMMLNKFKEAREGFLITLALALLFTYVQFDEFFYGPFSISDGIFGSCFYMITGLHGFHVIIGTIFILVCYARYKKPTISISSNELIPHSYYVFTTKASLGFEFASWYWHFVDVVWLYVYTFLYWWSSL